MQPLENEKVFHDCFDDADDVFNQFKVKPEDREGVIIHFAIYEQEFYQGTAYVLFEKDGKLFEVCGGHCSCYGLEDQWDVEEVSLNDFVSREERDAYTASACRYPGLDEVLDHLRAGGFE